MIATHTNDFALVYSRSGGIFKTFSKLLTYLQQFKIDRVFSFALDQCKNVEIYFYQRFEFKLWVKFIKNEYVVKNYYNFQIFN